VSFNAFLQSTAILSSTVAAADYNPAYPRGNGIDVVSKLTVRKVDMYQFLKKI
jgi:hypothetical protein